MIRYLVEAGDDWFEPASQTISVICADDDRPVDTGLVNAQGHALYRLPEKHPIGFRPRRPVVRVKAGSRPVG